jgi:IclR family transcriptional regulator, pca regulon regulatory protein
VSDEGKTGEFVQSLERGLAVIKAFSEDAPRLTLTEVAAATGLSRAAARRFLLTLESLGYVGTDGRQFYLRPRLLDLGYAYLSSFTVSEIAQCHLEQLARSVHESCSASVLDGEDIVYVARAAASRIMTIRLAVGTRLPAYCTSMGRVLLAALAPEDQEEYLRTARLEARTPKTVTTRDALREELRQAARQGYALVDQELEDGVRSVAVPIRDARGRTVAAVNATAHATRVTLATLRESFLPRLRECAAAVEADLGTRR